VHTMRRRGMRQLKTARRARRAVPRGGQTLAGAGSGVEGDGAEGPAAEDGRLEADGGEESVVAQVRVGEDFLVTVAFAALHELRDE
jgi:hypothetical protein